MSNIQKQETKMEALTVKSLFNKDDVKSKFQELLGKRASSFITSVLQIVSQNKLLAQADPVSIYHSAAVAATLDLPLNNNLGFAYIVPYNAKQPDGSYKQVAQFQMGYKGFIQLAQRSGQFLTISATHITDKDVIKGDRLIGTNFEFSNEPGLIIGYAAYFKLLNGFEKTLYMTTKELKDHGLKYSKTYSNPKTKNTSLWENDFNAMATKTVLKLLLAKFAPLSIEMQKAVVVDQSVINNPEGTEVTYLDNEETVIDKEAERVALMIQDAQTMEELMKIKEHVKPEQMPLYEEKFELLASQENGLQ
jgi:recombination protein RecT